MMGARKNSNNNLKSKSRIWDSAMRRAEQVCKSAIHLEGMELEGDGVVGP